jgi:DNA-directed RNA polymerase subunit RPC12/RpoP
MKMVCANCRHNGIEAGEAGAPSRCAQCGHTRFVNAETVVKPAPAIKAPAAKPSPVKSPASRWWFDQMHAVVDANAPKKS